MSELERRLKSVALLVSAETEFLLAHGWTIVEPDLWLPPPGMFDDERRATDPRRTGHAVNTQKFFTYRRW